MSPLFLIDGSGFIFRAFHALPPLTTSQGVPVGAVLGFCNMLVRLKEQKNPTHWAIFFDSKYQNFRHNLFADYKKHRSVPDEALVPQFEIVREACRAFNIPIIEQDHMEADDLIASYAIEAKKNHYKVEIVSSDKDMFQLLDEDIKMYDPLQDKYFDQQAVYKKFGVYPSQMVDFQALIGDASDNIAGIPGVGPKTGASWIQEFGSLDHLLKNYHTLKTEKKRKLIEENKDWVLLCQKLVTLKKDCPISVPLEKLGFSLPNVEKLVHFLDRYHFASLKERLKKKGWLLSLEKKSHLDLLEISAAQCYERALQKGKISVIPAEAACTFFVATTADEYLYVDFSADIDIFKKLMESESILKVLYDVKKWLHFLKKYSIKLYAFDDLMLMSYLAEEGKGTQSFEDFLHLYDESFSKDICNTLMLQLHMRLKQTMIEKNLWHLYQKVERPLSVVLMEMESKGICISKEKIQEAQKEFEEERVVLEEKIYTSVGRKDFNIASGKQLGEILFEELKWPAGKKGKSGAYSTSSDILEELSQTYPLASLLLEWRQLSKLISTYTSSLLAQVDPKTSRIHTHFNMAATSTGRLSSTDPNLQNIPIRTPEGRKIRASFCASKGKILSFFDYSQIELRILAHVADVSALKEAFLNHEDVHEKTARSIFKLGAKDVCTPQQRRQAKTVNFGIVYGQTPYGLSRQLGIAQEDAKSLIEAYFDTYKEIRDYIEETKKQARQKGYVETLWGRRCHIAHIQDKNYQMRSMAERQAVNAPLQGTSADFIKDAMIKIDAFLKEKKLFPESQLLLQIHDELVLEMPLSVFEDIKTPLAKILSQVAKLKVPLEVHTYAAQYWDQD